MTNDALSKQRRSLAGLFVISTVLICGAFGYLNWSGYCLTKKLYLTDEKVVLAALRSKSRSIRGLPSGAETISDGELNTFISSHRGCCEIAGTRYTEPYDSTFSRIIGNGYRWVHLVYELKPNDPLASPNEPFYEALVRVTPCGRAHDQYRTGLSRSEFDGN